MALNLSFPDSIYTEANKPVAATLKADLAAIETEVNTIVKATGAEINTGTNDTKFDTPKALADSIIFSAWTSYTPVVDQGASTNIAKTISYAKYKQIGKTVFVNMRLDFTGTGSAGSRVTITMPVTPAYKYHQTIGAGTFNDSGVGGYSSIVVFNNSTTKVTFVANSTNLALGENPNIGIASGDELDLSVVYEAE